MILKKLLNKNLLGCIFFVFLTLLIVFNLFLYVISGKWFWETFMYEPLTEAEIQEKLPTLIRNYPDIIKGNWEPNQGYMEKMLMSDSDRLKDMGVNTVSVAAEYEFDKDGNPFMRDEEIRRSNIIRAKEEGFAVWIGVSFVGMSGRLGSDITQEDFLKVSEEVALEWAKIAEECKVEFFDPQTELDFIIEENFPEGSLIKAETLADWHEQMLPKIKEVYSGKVIAKFAWVEEEMIITGSQYIGYDYVGIAICHRFEGLKDYRDTLIGEYSLIADLASESNSEWIVGESFYNYGSLFFPIPINLKGGYLSALQDDYYKISIEEYLEFEENKPVGYIFHSWKMPGTAIKGRPAEDVLSDFFNGL